MEEKKFTIKVKKQSLDSRDSLFAVQSSEFHRDGLFVLEDSFLLARVDAKTSRRLYFRLGLVMPAPQACSAAQWECSPGNAPSDLLPWDRSSVHFLRLRGRPSPHT